MRVVLDIKEGSDSLDRTTLILKLEKMNMKNSTFNWFITYHENERHLEEILE